MKSDNYSEIGQCYVLVISVRSFLIFLSVICILWNKILSNFKPTSSFLLLLVIVFQVMILYCLTINRMDNILHEIENAKNEIKSELRLLRPNATTVAEMNTDSKMETTTAPNSYIAYTVTVKDAGKLMNGNYKK